MGSCLGGGHPLPPPPLVAESQSIYIKTSCIIFRRVVNMTISLSLCFSLQRDERRTLYAIRETEFLRLKRTRIGRDDFESLKVIGKGAFGEVSFTAVYYILLYTKTKSRGLIG